MRCCFQRSIIKSLLHALSYFHTLALTGVSCQVGKCPVEKSAWQKKERGFCSQQGIKTLSPTAHEKLNIVHVHMSELGRGSSPARPSEEGIALADSLAPNFMADQYSRALS